MRLLALLLGVFCCVVALSSIGIPAASIAQSVTTRSPAATPSLVTAPAPPTPTPYRVPLSVYNETPTPDAPQPCSTPSGILCYSAATPTVFILALAQDPATGVALEIELQNRFMRVENSWRGRGVNFSAAPFGWGLADFVNTCNAAPLYSADGKNYRGIAGALVIFAASMQANSYNYLLVTRGESRIDADAQFIKCDIINQSKGAGSGAHARPVGILFDDLIGAGNRNSFSFGTAAAVASAINALNNSRTDSYTYPSPGVTGSPYINSYTVQHGYNVNTTGAVAAAAVAGLASGTQLNFPANNVPVQLKAAAQHLADDLYRQACWDTTADTSAPTSAGAGPSSTPVPVTGWGSLMQLVKDVAKGAPACPLPQPSPTP